MLNDYFCVKRFYMEYLPIFIDLRQRPVLVVGGGIIAAHKIKLLINFGVQVQIVTHTLCQELINMENIGLIHWIGKDFNPKMLDNVFLVITASNDHILNTLVAQHANKRYLLVNSVDDITNCSFIFPAIIDRRPIIVAISSGGSSPMMVRILRENLEEILPSFLGTMAKLIGSWRQRVKQKIPSSINRYQFWKKILSNNFISLITQGKFTQAERFIEYTLINDSSKKNLF